LKGAGIHVYWPELAALIIFATLTLGLASVRLSRQWA
jgi:hypothetical protein